MRDNCHYPQTRRGAIRVMEDAYGANPHCFG
jgi:hypothetical protein